MKPEIIGFTEHALDRFIERSGMTRPREQIMGLLLKCATHAVCVKKIGKTRVLESITPDKSKRVWRYLVRKGIVHTVYWRKATDLELFAAHGPKGIS